MRVSRKRCKPPPGAFCWCRLCSDGLGCIVKEAFRLLKRDLQAINAFRSIFFGLFRSTEDDIAIHSFQYKDTHSISLVHYRCCSLFHCPSSRQECLRSGQQLIFQELWLSSLMSSCLSLLLGPSIRAGWFCSGHQLALKACSYQCLWTLQLIVFSIEPFLCIPHPVLKLIVTRCDC